MKKLILMFLAIFLLTGCSNTISFDFNDNIDAKVDLSFTLSEYKAYSAAKSNVFSDDEEARSSIDAIRFDNEAFDSNNSALFEEKKFITDGNNYNASYEYTYTYSNFLHNSVLNNCIEYFTVENDDESIYVSLKGNSSCGPFKLSIKAKDRMINNNAKNINGDEYIWNINATNNDVYFAISKTPNSSSSISVLYVIYFLIGIALAFVAYMFKKKKNNR